MCKIYVGLVKNLAILIITGLCGYSYVIKGN